VGDMGKLRMFHALLDKKYHSLEVSGKDMNNYIFIPTFREKIKKPPEPDKIIEELSNKKKELEEKYRSYKDLLRVSEESTPMFISNQNQSYITDRKKELIKARVENNNSKIVELKSVYNHMEDSFKSSPEVKLVEGDQDVFFQIIREHKMKSSSEHPKDQPFNGIFEQKDVTDPIIMGSTYLDYEQLSLLLFTLAQSIERGDDAIVNKIAKMVIKHNSSTYHRYLFRLVWCKMNDVKIVI